MKQKTSNHPILPFNFHWGGGGEDAQKNTAMGVKIRLFWGV